MSEPGTPTTPLRVTIVGASGYVGGELCRLLCGHPRVELVHATSEHFAGRRLDRIHPNLRAVTDLAFCAVEDCGEADVVMLATPHGAAMARFEKLAALGARVVDLSADFRLADAATWRRYYGIEHAAPEHLGTFVPGCPELFRRQLAGADRISVPGCMATAAVLALHPLAEAGLIEPEVTVDARTGSSGAGRSATASGNSHAERSHSMRVFAPAGHRHEAEIAALTGLDVHMSATGVEAVRGVQVVCHAQARRRLEDKEVRAAYRAAYAAEPFVRIVAHYQGDHRFPDPKVLIGSNFCDVGFAVDGSGRRVTAMAALDNLVKGGAGAAVQCLNIRMGWPERTGLEFAGLHPL